VNCCLFAWIDPDPLCNPVTRRPGAMWIVIRNPPPTRFSAIPSTRQDEGYFAISRWNPGDGKAKSFGRCRM
jgi:hypothetical protein